MEKRAREKAGLAIFLVLVALGGILLGGYFLTGRSWSVAATMVDDTVGSLDRYTVVAFSGTTPPEEEAIVYAKGSSDSSASSSSAGVSSSSSSTAASSSQLREIDPEFTMRDAFGASNGTAAESGVRESILSIFERQDRRNASLDDTVYVSDVRDLYALKGANGLTLNISDPARYTDPIVLNAGNKKIGIFSIASYISRAKLKSTIAALKEQGADAVMCIAPRSTLLSTFDDIDVVVLTNPQEGRADEREHPSTLIVESPEVGDVGVVLLSSNNVPSFKVVKEL